MRSQVTVKDVARTSRTTQDTVTFAHPRFDVNTSGVNTIYAHLMDRTFVPAQINFGLGGFVAGGSYDPPHTPPLTQHLIHRLVNRTERLV